MSTGDNTDVRTTPAAVSAAGERPTDASRAARREAPKFDAGSIDDFPQGKFTIVELPIGSVGVLRTKNGLIAYRNRCPHMGGPICMGKFGGTTLESEPDELVYGFQDDVLRCPWHGWEFHVSTGESVYNMFDSKLIRYKAELVDGRVLVSRR